MASKRKRTPKAVPLPEQLTAAQKKKEELEAAKADINSQLTACNADIERIRGLITLEELKGVGEKAKSEGITAADLSACIQNPEVLAAIKKAIGKSSAATETDASSDTSSETEESAPPKSEIPETPSFEVGGNSFNRF